MKIEEADSEVPREGDKDLVERILEGAVIPDADEISGYNETGEHLKSASNELDKLAGFLLYLARMAVQGADPVTYACGETRSFLIMNKCYGQWFDVPTKGTEGASSYPLFSAFLERPKSRKDLRRRFRAEELVFMPPYGGTKPGSGGAKEVRPCIMDERTVSVLGASNMGWRALVYTNRGEGDPHPSGVVALEGWKMRLDKDAEKKYGEAGDAEMLAAFQSVHDLVFAPTKEDENGEDE